MLPSPHGTGATLKIQRDGNKFDLDDPQLCTLPAYMPRWKWINVNVSKEGIRENLEKKKMCSSASPKGRIWPLVLIKLYSGKLSCLEVNQTVGKGQWLFHGKLNPMYLHIANKIEYSSLARIYRVGDTKIFQQISVWLQIEWLKTVTF